MGDPNTIQPLGVVERLKYAGAALAVIAVGAAVAFHADTAEAARRVDRGPHIGTAVSGTFTEVNGRLVGVYNARRVQPKQSC